MRSPIEIVDAAYAAMADKDLERWIAVCHPDAVIVQDPALPWGGEHVGRDGIATFAIALVGAIDSRVTRLAMFEAGDHVVQYGRTAGTTRATNRPFDIAECHVWTVRDGLVSRMEFYIDTATMLAVLESSG
jgi:ketosteroid isomerase-like protein